MLDAFQFQNWQEDIRYCQELTLLQRLVERIVAPTGFGENRLSGEDVGESLDYREMADCLREADAAYFQNEIRLLQAAADQVDMIAAGQVPERPKPILPWEFLS
ncbi:MAG: hypothetical protein ACO1RX_07055 [Candidatus Sericytochromatia bacterium]